MISFKIVFCLEIQYRYLKQSISRVELIIKVLCRLLEVDDVVFLLKLLILYSFGQYLANIEVSLGT